MLEFNYEINYEINNIRYILLSQLFTIIGMYGVFRKMDEESRIAFAPFINYAKLGEVVEKPVMGVLAAVFGILNFGLTWMDFYTPSPFGANVKLTVSAVIGILYIIFKMIVLNALRKTFGRKWGWMILFFFVPGLTLAFYGYSKKIKM